MTPQVKTKWREFEQNHRMNEIIDAAESFYFKTGDGKFSMDELAERAEFTKRTIYSYFKSKEQLFNAIVLRGFTINKQMLDDVLAGNQNATGYEKLTLLAQTLVSFATKYPDYFRITMDYQYHEVADQADDEITASCNMSAEYGVELLIKTIDEGVKDGSISPAFANPVIVLSRLAMLSGTLLIIMRKEDYLKKIGLDPKLVVENALQHIITDMPG